LEEQGKKFRTDLEKKGVAGQGETQPPPGRKREIARKTSRDEWPEGGGGGNCNKLKKEKDSLHSLQKRPW